MALDFCTRAGIKLRKIEQAENKARHFASFFYVSVVSLCGAMLFLSKKNMRPVTITYE